MSLKERLKSILDYFGIARDFNEGIARKVDQFCYNPATKETTFKSEESLEVEDNICKGGLYES